MHDSAEIPQLRRHEIAQRLSGGQPVNAARLAVEFGVSEDAVRRDLRALAGQGLCLRVYGGALPMAPAPRPIGQRLDHLPGRKRALAQAALALVQPGMTVFLDAGSTGVHLAALLGGVGDLRVVTNSVPAAAAMVDMPGVQVFVLGGAMQGGVGACVDAQAHAALGRYRIDLCVLGACAVSVKAGLAGFDMADVEFKRHLVEASATTLLMMTNDKLEISAPFSIAPVAAIADLVLEADAPTDAIADLRALTRLHFAPPSET